MNVSEFVEAEQIQVSASGHDEGEATFSDDFDEFVDQPLSTADLAL